MYIYIYAYDIYIKIFTYIIFKSFVSIVLIYTYIIYIQYMCTTMLPGPSLFNPSAFKGAGHVF